jgi:hypothetical protein
MWRVRCLEKSRSKIIELEHGCSEGYHWKGMLGFNFLHFLSVVVIYLKGIHMNWWFKRNQFPP